MNPPCTRTITALCVPVTKNFRLSHSCWKTFGYYSVIISLTRCKFLRCNVARWDFNVKCSTSEHFVHIETNKPMDIVSGQWRKSKIRKHVHRHGLFKFIFNVFLRWFLSVLGILGEKLPGHVTS